MTPEDIVGCDSQSEVIPQSTIGGFGASEAEYGMQPRSQPGVGLRRCVLEAPLCFVDQFAYRCGGAQLHGRMRTGCPIDGSGGNRCTSLEDGLGEMTDRGFARQRQKVLRELVH